MKEKEFLKKTIRFNYFEVSLIADDKLLKEAVGHIKRIEYIKTLKKLTDKQNEYIKKEGEILEIIKKLRGYKATRWNMENMFNFFAENRDKSTSHLVDGYYLEIEPDSFMNDKQFISFQIAKLKAYNIPSKKEKGSIQKPIKLNEREYICDPVSILYEKDNHVIMIQSNLYGASKGQIEEYFTLLRKSYLTEISDNQKIRELRCELRLILDSKKIIQAKSAECYTKIRIKGSDMMTDSLIGQNKTILTEAFRTMGKTKGVNIDLTISLNETEETKSLDKEEIIGIIDRLNEMDEIPDNCVVEVSKRDEEESNVDIVNLIVPRMTDTVSIDIKPRTTIQHSVLRNYMIIKYKKRYQDICRILRPLNKK